VDNFSTKTIMIVLDNSNVLPVENLLPFICPTSSHVAGRWSRTLPIIVEVRLMQILLVLESIRFSVKPFSSELLVNKNSTSKMLAPNDEFAYDLESWTT
jgi:hypothetical protein